MVGLTALFPQLPGAADAGAAGAALPTDPVGAPLGGDPDPLNTVGLALLAYGLVQLLSKVIDKLPVWKGGGDPPHGGGGGAAAAPAGFTADDRKRLERVLEQAVADRERMERLHEAVREILEATRWMADARRTDPRDGEPLWTCRARGMTDQLAVHQRLIGQALDELREVNAKQDNVLRKLRALWIRVGRRRKDRG